MSSLLQIINNLPFFIFLSVFGLLLLIKSTIYSKICCDRCDKYSASKLQFLSGRQNISFQFPYSLRININKDKGFVIKF